MPECARYKIKALFLGQVGEEEIPPRPQQVVPRTRFYWAFISDYLALMGLVDTIGEQVRCLQGEYGIASASLGKIHLPEFLTAPLLPFQIPKGLNRIWAILFLLIQCKVTLLSLGQNKSQIAITSEHLPHFFIEQTKREYVRVRIAYLQ
jgi:hypothetical protein